MTVNHCDGDRLGQPCRTLFAVGLMACPHCKSPDFHEFGSWPEDEEHPMAKISALTGPTNASVPTEVVAAEQRGDEPQVEPAAVPTINSILAEVGDDPDRALAALEAEQARGDAARSTLVNKLTKILDNATTSEEPVDETSPVDLPEDDEAESDDSEPVDAA